MLITKYFRFSDRHFYAGGAFKFGTLEEYRNTENALELAGRSDNSDGLLVRSFSGSIRNVEGATIGGIRIENVNQVEMSDVVSSYASNEWIFCASEGNYSAEHHAKMIDGDPITEYAGNRKLLCWATIDLYVFLDAAGPVARRRYGSADYRDPCRVLAVRVTYDKEVDFVRVNQENYLSNEINIAPFQKIVCAKPSAFSTEREIRVILRPNGDRPAPLGAPPLYIDSTALKKSIVSIGP